MEKNQYQIEGVIYSFNRSSRKWHFATASFQYIISCPGGKITADKIAKQIGAAMKRTKNAKIDGIARKNIDTILHECNAVNED